MTGFMSRAACRGRRPNSHASFNGRERSTLITRLLKDRNVARFIVAPSGYGKTSLALEYAETIFDWAHVFWVNAQSPCFIRDLDAGELSKLCFTLDEKAALVVFDDVPALSAERMDLLSREIDALLAHRCEVIVTCVPACCMGGSLQRDRVQVRASDLLLDDAELDEYRSSDERMRTPAELVKPSARIPGLAWPASEVGPSCFAREVLYEDIPSDLLLITACALVLQQGTFDDLQALVSFDCSMIAEIADDYPHLGLDVEAGRFEASVLDIASLSVPVKNRLKDMATRSAFESAEDLASAWAAHLMSAGKADRACDLVRGVCARGYRASWLIENAYELVTQACFFPTMLLARDRESCQGVDRMRLDALNALCCHKLGNGGEAIKVAKRHAFNEDAPIDVRTLCLLVIARLDVGQLAVDACKALNRVDDFKTSEAPETDALWVAIAHAYATSRCGLPELAALWDAFLRDGVDDRALCLCASWLFDMMDESSRDILGSPSATLRSVEQYLRDRLSYAREGEIDYFTASAGMAMEEARERGMKFEGGPLETPAMIRIWECQKSVQKQRASFEEDLHIIEVRRGDWARTHPDIIVRQSDFRMNKRKSAVPILMVKLFGRFEVSIGDELIDQKCFHRQTTRSLLVLLTVNKGKDLSREALANAMWPESAGEVARKNFYTVWSELRQALTLPNGTCPYLVRHQYGCCLESHHVQSDVARLNEICREFMFGTPNIEVWSKMFAEIDRDFSGDLMPSEGRNPLVIEARDEYRTRLADALVAATASAIEVGYPQWGIWFARAAIARDAMREDAYIALMRAQNASGQRAAAIEAFHKYKRVLADRLGIDPSPEIKKLYEDLLD